MSDSANAASTNLKEIGNFELISKLGAGAMGAVFKARQKSLDRIVALKILPPTVAKDQKFIERFLREARTSAKLNHPNIVQGIDVGCDPNNGLYYFAMEYVDGPTLRAVLKEQGVLPEKRALEITRQIASALESAQRHGIVHRDIKPDNILLTSQGEAKLADLGLAKQTKTEDASLTMGGQAVGTPYYMSPEQVRGAQDELSICTDIYSLGATLFHLLTGQPPFSGPTPAVIMAKHLSEAAPSVRQFNPNVSDACNQLVAHMLQKDAAKRPQTAEALVAAIDGALAGVAVAPPQAPRLRTGRHPPVRTGTTGPRQPVGATRQEADAVDGPPKRGALIAGVATAVAVVAAMGLWLIFGKSEKTEPVAAAKALPAPHSEAAPPSVPGPPPPALKPAEAPASNHRNELAATALEEVLRGAPTDTFDKLSRLHALKDKVAGTPSQAAWATALKQTQEAVQLALTLDYAALAAFKEKCAHAPLADLYAQALKQAESKALEAWTEASGSAQKQADSGDFDAARQALQAFAQSPVPVVVEAAKAKIDALAVQEKRHAEQAQAQAEAARQQGQKLRYELYEALLKATEKCDLNAARQILGTWRAKPEMKVFTGELTKAADEIKWLEEQTAAACNAMVTNKKTLEIPFGKTMTRATVTRAAPTGVEVIVEGGTGTTLTFGKLAVPDLLGALGWENSAQSAFNAARFLFWRNQLAAAQKRLAQPVDENAKELAERIALLLTGSERFYKAQTPRNLTAAVPKDRVGPDHKALEGAKDVPVELAWESGSPNTQKYRIERNLGQKTFQALAETTREVTKYCDEKVPLDTSVAYRVVALNAAGESEPTPERALQTPPPKVVNLLVNGDFEQGNLNPWSIFDVLTKAVVLTNEGVHSGRGALLMHTDGRGCMQKQKVHAGQNYQVTGWVKLISQAGRCAGVGVMVQDMRYNQLGRSPDFVLQDATNNEKKIPANEWTKFQFPFTPKEDDLMVSIHNPGGKIEAMLDDLVLSEAP